MGRSGDLVSYTAEEGVRILGEGKLLVSDSFPGNERNKYCLSSKVCVALLDSVDFRLSLFAMLFLSLILTRNSDEKKEACSISVFVSGGCC